MSRNNFVYLVAKWLHIKWREFDWLFVCQQSVSLCCCFFLYVTGHNLITDDLIFFASIQRSNYKRHAGMQKNKIQWWCRPWSRIWKNNKNEIDAIQNIFFLICRWSKKIHIEKKRFAEKFAAVKVIFYEYECNNRSIKFWEPLSVQNHLELSTMFVLPLL